MNRGERTQAGSDWPLRTFGICLAQTRYISNPDRDRTMHRVHMEKSHAERVCMPFVWHWPTSAWLGSLSSATERQMAVLFSVKSAGDSRLCRGIYSSAYLLSLTVRFVLLFRTLNDKHNNESQSFFVFFRWVTVRCIEFYWMKASNNIVRYKFRYCSEKETQY